MRRKGQAAMEFLMTYGWAILVAIVVIGLLGYYYLDSISQRHAGMVNPPFYLNAHRIDETTGLTLELKNNGGETYNITSVAVSVSEPSGAACTTNNTAIEISTGTQTIYTLPCTGTSSGNSFSGDITITYMKQGSSVALTSTGSVADTVAA
jgi:hypothetical protein